VGDVTTPRASLALLYRNETPDIADKDVVVAFSFVVKEDVDPFSLGELSGSAKQLLGMFFATKGKEFKYELKSSFAEEDGSRVFTLRFVWHSEEAYEGAQKVFQYYNPQSFEAGLELNQAPIDPADDFIQDVLNQISAWTLLVLSAVLVLRHKMVSIGFLVRALVTLRITRQKTYSSF
jgi:hypothetical protein